MGRGGRSGGEAGEITKRFKIRGLRSGGEAGGKFFHASCSILGCKKALCQTESGDCTQSVSEVWVFIGRELPKIPRKTPTHCRFVELSWNPPNRPQPVQKKARIVQFVNDLPKKLT